MTLPEFAIVLQTRAHINRPVIDRTGLTGSYDITVRANPSPATWSSRSSRCSNPSWV
jgi:uncharacterized protein (TIGR03435 family)